MEFLPHPGSNFLIGANAEGKTSILEAICVTLRLQSPRATSLGEAVRTGQPGFGLSARVHGAHLQFRFESGKRTLRLDSVEQSSNTDYLRVARVAWFSNDDLEIVRGPAAKRRRYLDFLCSQLDPAYLRALRRYDRALRSRNALLRDNRPRREIEAFDPALIESGDLLTAVRTEALRAIAPLIAAAAHDISGQSENPTVRYEPGATAPLAEALTQSRDREIRLRQTVTGPHRDDFALEINGLAAAKFASEGQQRTLALALKLAQTRLLIARTGSTPILLIDDVFGELDIARRTNLLHHLPSDSQRLITTTHLSWLDSDSPGTIFDVRDRMLARIASS